MNTTDTKIERLVLRRLIAAPQKRVYHAWTDRQEMMQWGAPEDLTIPQFDCDFRVGGAYRLVMQKPDGERLTVKGEYREIRPHERVAYTWTWEEDEGEPEITTLVTVEFHDRGGQTEVVLTQEGFASEASRLGHTKGWTSILEKLEAFAAA